MQSSLDIVLSNSNPGSIFLSWISISERVGGPDVLPVRFTNAEFCLQYCSANVQHVFPTWRKAWKMTVVWGKLPYTQGHEITLLSWAYIAIDFLYRDVECACPVYTPETFFIQFVVLAWQQKSVCPCCLHYSTSQWHAVIRWAIILLTGIRGPLPDLEL